MTLNASKVISTACKAIRIAFETILAVIRGIPSTPEAVRIPSGTIPARVVETPGASDVVLTRFDLTPAVREAA
jgi:hypothetical protein